MTDKDKTEYGPDLRPFASSPCSMHELDPDFQFITRAGDWEFVRTWRRNQRKRLIAQRQTLKGGERRRISEAVCQFLEFEAGIHEDSMGFYWPLDGEIDLRPLMHKLAERHVELALPVITGKDQPMEFWAWDTNTQMQNQPVWNIPAPIERNLITPSVLFVPLLGFDKQGHRLGHGGGYYDRTLAELDPKPRIVGIGYEFGSLETIYPQDHDVPMDVIVTEQSLRTLRGI